ncbi:MAG: DNA replication/repair protein RecF [Oscillospiraceae bacterium]
MKINHLTLKDFRNIGEMHLAPCEGINIIYGNNAQGKTNLIESIWLFTGAKSFRNCKDRDFLRFGTGQSILKVTFQDEIREQTAKIIIDDKNKVSLNEIDLASRTKLAGNFYSVIFSPIHLSLVKDGPALRRKFLDGAIGQLKPSYLQLLTTYNRILDQRNALLKDVYHHSSLLDMLDIWDDHFIQVNSKLIKIRKNYMERLSQHAFEIYNGITMNQESLDVSYTCSTCDDFDCENLQEMVRKQLKSIRSEDLKTGITNVGIHRDDIELNINGVSARGFASQGQQRSAVLALKLAECEIIQSYTKTSPIVLLDDVMSELDQSRRAYILNHLKNKQVFITCCDDTYFKNFTNGCSFQMIDGAICKKSC